MREHGESKPSFLTCNAGGDLRRLIPAAVLLGFAESIVDSADC